jgi:DNA-binding beta-propeller fold protein YncE
MIVVRLSMVLLQKLIMVLIAFLMVDFTSCLIPEPNVTVPCRSAEQRAYVTQSGNLLIIDVSTQEIIYRIPSVGSELAISPNGTEIYVASAKPTISVIDTKAGRIIRTISLPFSNDQSYKLAVTPDGKWLYVTCPSNNTVLMVNIEEGKIVYTTKVAGTPIGVAIMPDGTQIYIPIDNGTILVMSHATHEVTHRIPFRSGGTGKLASAEIKFTPNGKLAYGSYYSPCCNGISIIDTINNIVISVAPPMFNVIIPLPIVTFVSGTQVYVVTNSRSISIGDVRTYKGIDNAITGFINSIVDITVTPDGEQVYALCGRQNDDSSGIITVIDVATRNIIDVFSIGGGRLGKIVMGCVGLN